MFRRGSQTAVRNLREVLEENVVPFVPIIGANLTLMQDNAGLHVARITMDIKGWY